MLGLRQFRAGRSWASNFWPDPGLGRGQDSSVELEPEQIGNNEWVSTEHIGWGPHLIKSYCEKSISSRHFGLDPYTWKVIFIIESVEETGPLKPSRRWTQQEELIRYVPAYLNFGWVWANLIDPVRTWPLSICRICTSDLAKRLLVVWYSLGLIRV